MTPFRVLEEHWKVGDVAAAFGISERTAYRWWLARWRYQSIACSSSINGTTAVSSEDLHTLRRVGCQNSITLLTLEFARSVPQLAP